MACRGVGYGVCQRLLVQLYHKNTPDALPQAFSPNSELNERAPAGYRGVTLILACRNPKRGAAARADLVTWLDDHIAKLLLTCTEDEGEYIRGFRIDIQVLELDLASVSSTLKFADAVRKRYVALLVRVPADSSGALQVPICVTSRVQCRRREFQWNGLDSVYKATRGKPDVRHHGTGVLPPTYRRNQRRQSRLGVAVECVWTLHLGMLSFTFSL